MIRAICSYYLLYTCLVSHYISLDRQWCTFQQYVQSFERTDYQSLWLPRRRHCPVDLSQIEMYIHVLLRRRHCPVHLSQIEMYIHVSLDKDNVLFVLKLLMEATVTTVQWLLFWHLMFSADRDVYTRIGETLQCFRSCALRNF